MNRSILIPILGTLFLGCATEKAWVYAPASFQQTASLSQRTATVLPFEDGRKNENSNRTFMYLIPLVPYGWQDLNVPEGTPMHLTSAMWMNYKPTEDFAKALATELQNARVFEESRFDYGRGAGDVVIRGKIVSTRYESKIISYGLSVYGPMLWFIGLPSGTFSNSLAIELAVVDASSNTPLFEETYSVPPYSKTVWLYSLPSDFNYAEMLKQAYGKFIADLRAQPAVLAPQ